MKDLTNKNGVFDVHTEDVMVPEWKRGLESLKMLRPRLKQLSILGIGLSVPTDGKITAEVIVVSSFEELESIDNAIIKGKIILFNTNFTTYENTIQYRRNSAVKAARKGAVAVLVRSITPISLYTTHTGDLVYEPHVKKIPAAAITIEDADFLQRIHNRGEVIVIEIQMSNELKANISRNLIIDVKGYDIPDKMVIVSGHIDSWDVGQGAIDDGGGMMISWFVPVVLNYLKLKPRRTLRAILWTSEEVGLNGAKAYLERHSDELDNIDFIMESDEGTFKPLGLEVAGSKNVTCLINEILQLFKPWDLNRLKVANSTGSDISIFIDKGIPGASLLNKDDRYFWYHHSNADTLTAQNKSDVLDCAAFWAAISYLIAELPVDIRRS
ncbi:Plasma glutamate carboxypeptidase [Danaus plexippus plexippus]|uniref:Carboxypeptidase Q n=1 Tax=Danaus plexippus plexippus TaxID=278856 RepID=A0A212F1M6_DANPL|nr:Plasma glutamate carboxypeptidase [Danaus plexippus plexippus]